MKAIVGFIVLFSWQSIAGENGFFFDSDPSYRMSRNFVNGDRPYCEKVFDPPIVQEPLCPYPPKIEKKKNGRRTGVWVNCSRASQDALGRHAPGYREFILQQVEEASTKTRAFSAEGVDPTLMLSLLNRETYYYPMVYNSHNDVGIAQFQVGTADSTLRYMRTLGMDVPLKSNRSVPPGCVAKKQGAGINVGTAKLGAQCFKAIKTHCLKEPYSTSLYCPQFALKLMAFHILEVQKRLVNVEYNERRYDVSSYLVPPGDTISEVRYVTGVYNRGYRIYNSALHSFMQKNVWPIANEYGPLWSTRRPSGTCMKGKSCRLPDPFYRGNLHREDINRCYNWDITGICGGLETSLLEFHTEQLCRPDAALMARF